jgi:hypothetical protein
MPETIQQIYFKCPKCSAELLWNARVAGHKVSCPCGHVFVAPMRAAVLAGDVEPEPEREPPKRKEELDRLWMRPRKRVVVDDDEEKSGPIRSWVVPSILIVIGLMITMTQVTWEEKELPKIVDLSFAQIMMIVLAMVVTLYASVALVTYLMNIDFGRLKPALYKMLSIPIFASALAITVARFDKDPQWITGLSMAWSVMILCYWVLFSVFFKLELWEVLVVSFVVSVVQAGALWAIFA